MENKCKKSSYHQLQALVEYMEEHPDFARGSAVYGGSKMSTEGQWVGIVKKLNSMGPPVRTVLEWKKTWADLKSRTKKKIAENNKSLRETGGGLYRMNNLTELEQIIDRTLSLSKSAAPKGGIFGYPNCNSKEIDLTNYFEALNDTPPRSSTTIAVITPTRKQQIPSNQSTQPTIISSISATGDTDDWFIPNVMAQNSAQKRKNNETEEELPGCPSAKKLKASNEQITLIRRQIRISEASAATAKEQAEATKTLAETTKELVAAMSRMADAAEVQAEAAKVHAEAAKVNAEAARLNAETQLKILESINNFRLDMANNFLNI